MSDHRSGRAQSAPPPKPTPYLHYELIRDAVTKGPVQFLTGIAALHTFGEDPDHDVYLKNFTRVAEPLAKSRIRVDNGSWLPASSASDSQGYSLYLTYNQLVSVAFHSHLNAHNADFNVDVRPESAHRMPLR